MRKQPEKKRPKKSVAFRLDHENLAWAVKQADSEHRNLSSFLNLLVTRAREGARK